jgi:hypothetical protein
LSLRVLLKQSPETCACQVFGFVLIALHEL